MPLTFPQDTPYLVQPEWLAQHLHEPQLRILDARLLENYAEGHIPFAAHVDLGTLRYTKHGVHGMLIEPEAFAEIAGGRLGIGHETFVVIYDDYFSQIAARIGWSLLRYGHARVAILDGGWDAWEAAGLPVSVEAYRPQAASFIPVFVDGHLAEYDWVRAHLHSLDVVLLDVRSPAEYAKGHVPGAVLWNWENGTSSVSSFAPAGELRTELSRLGVTPDKEIVTYCQSGMRAAHTFFLLRHLGFDRVRMYDGSWAEWSYKEGNLSHAS